MKLEKEIIFSEKIASFISHELRNILAVIKENTGLMDDLILMGKNISENSRFSELTKTTLSQVKSGEEITLLLNKFAHLNDKQVEKFNAYLIIDELVRLMKRPLKQKELSVSLDKIEEVNIETSKFYFQMILYFIIDENISKSSSGEVIAISSERKDGLQLFFKSDSAKSADANKLNEELDEHLSLLNGKILKQDSSIVFSIK